MEVRTRYAPSPTGFFHIGGARTALFNYLFAKHHNGVFIVRNEDTDVERNVEGGIESQLFNIDWLGFSPDESPIKGGDFAPYQQTKKIERYQQLANQLLEQNKAYRCFCTKEELEQERKVAEENHQTPKYNRKCLHLSQQEINEKLKNKIPYVLRLKIEDGDYAWNDLIRGPISIPSSAMTDPVIVKSNGIPMYNFAVVVDDYDMKITHILRGEEHISNTPYQIAIKKALDFDTQDINYGHLSIIVNEFGKKLSKRDVNLKQFIDDYRNMGYLPIAITNFLCLLGWTPKDNKEVLTLQEMIKNFDLTTISKSPAKFDVPKMNWISNQHFKLLSDNDYLDFVSEFVSSKNKCYLNNKDEVLLLFKNQISYALELNDLIDDLFSDSDQLDDNTLVEFNNLITPIKQIINFVEESVKNINNFSIVEIKKIIDIVKEKFQLNGKSLFMSIRIITTLKSHGPELAKTIFLLSQDKVIKNIITIKRLIDEKK